MKTIGLIGCGALAHIFARNLLRLFPDKFEITGVVSLNIDSSESFASTLGCRAFRTVGKMLEMKPDYVVEFASIEAVSQHGEKVLESGSDLVIASVGALADKELRGRLEGAAARAGSHLYVPSGAIGALDLMQVFDLRDNAEVEIENIKAPKGYYGAPHLKGRFPSQTEEEILFEGDVADAIKGFPKNVNVSVAASVACGVDKALVRVRSVPGLRENIHRIKLRNKLMHAELSFASIPDPANPRSSTTAAWSVIALLKNLESPIVFF